MTKVSVIIPTLPRNRDYLNFCLQSLIKNTTQFEIELLIAENGESTPYPQGQCQAVNRMAEFATHDWLFITNDDMYYAPDWDRNVDFDNLCWSPNLVEPIEQGSAPPFLKFDGGNTLESFKKQEVNTFIRISSDKEYEVGFNFPFFIRKDVWETIGGYDTMYDPWGSNGDTDLQMKIELTGITPQRNRGVLVYHFGSKSGTFDGSHSEEWWRNWHYLEHKWGFNRDDAKSDPWYCKDMILFEKLEFQPPWTGKYAKV